VFWWAQFYDHELKIIALALNLCCLAYVCFLKGLNWKTLLFVPLLPLHRIIDNVLNVRC
jgi:hypothetical protein